MDERYAREFLMNVETFCGILLQRIEKTRMRSKFYCSSYNVTLSFDHDSCCYLHLPTPQTLNAEQQKNLRQAILSAISRTDLDYHVFWIVCPLSTTLTTLLPILPPEMHTFNQITMDKSSKMMFLFKWLNIHVDQPDEVCHVLSEHLLE